MEWEKYCETYANKAQVLYQKFHKRPLDLANPVTFTEKLWWLKVYDSTMLKSYCADKINIHNYVKGKLGNDLCVPLLQVCDTPSQIKWGDLPNQFVIKCNHGSGYNIIVTDKNTINCHEINNTLDKWLHEDFAFKYDMELHYHLIKPRILIEEFIPQLDDIKVFCFNGMPSFYQIDRHFTEHRMNFYTPNWEFMPEISNNQYPCNPNIIDECPSNLAILNEYAMKLSQDFKFVRVDFLTSGGNLYVGELTFTPGGGRQTYTGNGDAFIGNMLDL